MSVPVHCLLEGGEHSQGAAGGRALRYGSMTASLGQYLDLRLWTLKRIEVRFLLLKKIVEKIDVRFLLLKKIAKWTEIRFLEPK